MSENTKLNPFHIKYAYIGKRIKNLRVKQGLTQIKLAKMCGLTQTRISSYEKGLMLPRFDTLFAISKALGVHYSDILGYEISKRDFVKYSKQHINPNIYYFTDSVDYDFCLDGTETKKDQDKNEDYISDFALMRELQPLNKIGREKVLDYIQDLKFNKKNLKESD